MQVKGGLGAIFRIIGGLPTGVLMINQFLADKKVTATELINFAVWAIELIAGKSLDELGIEVDF